MKKTILNAVFLLALTVSISSCSYNMPVDVSDNAKGTKTITSESLVIGQWFLNGDYGIHDALKKSGYEGKIFCVDERTTNYFFIFYKKELLITTAKND